MIPKFMLTRSIATRPDPPPSGKTDRVVLTLPTVNRPSHLDPFTRITGVIEDYIGDEMMVRFGVVVVQVPSEWIVPAE